MSFSYSLDTSKLDAIMKQLPGNRDAIIKAAAFHILGNAQKKAPVGKTGQLHTNAEVKSYNGYANVEFYAEYAAYVELGTSRMYARPFLRTSVETERQLFIDRIKKGLIKK